MLLCVLVSWNLAQESKVESAPCDISIQDVNSVTLNCSRRNIDEIPDNWPERINSVDKGNAAESRASSFIELHYRAKV